MRNHALWRYLVGGLLLTSACSRLDAAEPASEVMGVDASTLVVSETTTPSEPATTATPTTTAPSTTAPTTTTTVAPDELAWPTDSAATAAALTEAEQQVRTAGDPDVAARWGRRQQQLYQVLSLHRDWADEAVSLIDESIRPAVELNWRARQELSSLVSSGELSTTLPAWRIVNPPPADELLGYYKEAEAATGIPWVYLASINLVETRMGRIEGLSTAGAVGPMQFLPSTWEGCCVGDPTDPHDAILGAATYLTLVGGPADMDRALFGYNRSDRYVAAVKAYADVLALDERAYAGYHAWQVYFSSSVGVLRLTEGYESFVPIDAAEWLADHPDDLLGTN